MLLYSCFTCSFNGNFICRPYCCSRCGSWFVEKNFENRNDQFFPSSDYGPPISQGGIGAARRHPQLFVNRNGLIVHAVSPNGDREHARRCAVLLHKLVEPDADPCTICLEDIEDALAATIPSCQHQFHLHCIKKWLKQANSCPLCLTTVAK